MEQISKYFNEEKAESILFMIAGVIAIALSIYFLIKVKQPFYNGLSYSLIAIAIIQLSVGSIVYFRSPRDIVRVEQVFKNDKSKIQSEEIPRMRAVMKSFVLYRWVEIGLMITGLLLFWYFQPMNFWKGVGLGLFIQSTLMLILDFFAEKRGAAYLEYLQTFN